MRITDIIICALLVWIVYSTVRIAYGVIRSQVLIARAKKHGGIIRGRSTLYKLGSYIYVIVVELGFILFFSFHLLKNYYRYPLQTDLILFILLVSFAVMMVIHLLAVFMEKYAYLTSDGLICYIKVFRFSKCRFAWETDADGMLSDTLHVYPKKESAPYTVRFDQPTEEAHQLVSDNQVVF